METQTTVRKHIYFWDTIRYLVVFCVVAHHGACAYSKLVPWWYANTQRSTAFFDLLVVTFDQFVMPVLFFVSGYFALPSILRRGPWRFIKAKTRRLFVPMVFLTVFYVPFINFTTAIAWGRIEPKGFFTYWVEMYRALRCFVGAFLIRLKVRPRMPMPCLPITSGT